MADKIALAPCNGMSPNGLVSRVAVGDCRNENDNVISICMGSTSADIEGRNDEMLRKYPIVAVNEILEGFEVSARDPFRLDSEAEECVKIIKDELTKTINKIL